MPDWAWLLLLLAVLAAGAILLRLRRRTSLPAPARLEAREPETIALETQLARLAGVGITKRSRVSVEQLLQEASRGDYEARPYSRLLTLDPDDLLWSRQVLSLGDLRLPDGFFGYERLVSTIADWTGQADRLTGVTADYHYNRHEGEIRFTLDGEERTFRPTGDGREADAGTVAEIARLLAAPDVAVIDEYLDGSFVLLQVPEQQRDALRSLLDPLPG